MKFLAILNENQQANKSVTVPITCLNEGKLGTREGYWEGWS
ncbi:hypothetical protein PLAN_40861 [Planktothrix rubescens CCAP 1459/22]|uniref:Uncharacterized protein n=1 Tax=Planktothrix rubescens CCAP 1459/22 TaxID=329571 RepID=A0A6J7ZPY1_PLARU|nr:hypothetical protein PLAN_40861 [Planktothrix rubescens NIVA-CYA 18]